MVDVDLCSLSKEDSFQAVSRLSPTLSDQRSIWVRITTKLQHIGSIKAFKIIYYLSTFYFEYSEIRKLVAFSFILQDQCLFRK